MDEKSTSSDLLFIDMFREGLRCHTSRWNVLEMNRDAKLPWILQRVAEKSLMNFEIKMEHVEHVVKGFRENFAKHEVCGG